MVGRRQFDQDKVEDAIVRTFWDRGFCGSSIEDLETATNLRRGSLYNAYGGKQDMFALALERYGHTWPRRALDALAEQDPAGGLRGYIAVHMERMREPNLPRGCFQVCATIDIPHLSEANRVSLAKANREAVAALTERIKAGQRGGTFLDGRPAGELARFVSVVVRGAALLHRAGTPVHDLTGLETEVFRAVGHTDSG